MRTTANVASSRRRAECHIKGRKLKETKRHQYPAVNVPLLVLAPLSGPDRAAWLLLLLLKGAVRTGRSRYAGRALY